MKSAIQRFIRNEHAVSAIEYALLGGLIAVVIVISVNFVGTQLRTLFEYVSTEVSKAMS
ncbi:Flp family type IVb pilin [Pseudoduganella sp. OTU4001]|uniref:Flp family type IVb pilin n=1 Tax=Pseudoduganella sp. OTU4001 TaxID=3043854 RepID=UPI00313F2600